MSCLHLCPNLASCYAFPLDPAQVMRRPSGDAAFRVEVPFHFAVAGHDSGRLPVHMRHRGPQGVRSPANPRGVFLLAWALVQAVELAHDPMRCDVPYPAWAERVMRGEVPPIEPSIFQ